MDQHTRSYLESKDVLDRIRLLIKPIAARYPVDEIYLFGSRARGDGTPDSDYDFLIVPKKGMSAFQMCGLLNDLEEQFGTVDLVSSRSIKGEFEHNVLKERVLVYAE
ncbi:MAG: nucleotidyltransferase domain-containing protein [archaeon]|nr:nucleotidyltransferase domain-containing protein [archaeon]